MKINILNVDLHVYKIVWSGGKLPDFYVYFVI